MKIIDNPLLPVYQRLRIVAFQAGSRLNDTRPAHIGDGTPGESEVLPILSWLSAQNDHELAITSISVACEDIKHKWTSAKLLQRAQMLYDLCESKPDNPQPEPARTKTTRKKTTARSADNPA